MVKAGLMIDCVLKAGSFERAVSFEAPVGITAISGPSGCGKTTTLNTISGLSRPANGRITFNNKVWFDSTSKVNMSAQKRRTGYVFQNSALFPHLNIEKNILFGVTDTSASARTACLNRLTELFDLGDFLQLKPSQLSGGQSQRVALARALAPDPRVLLLDEPINALDRKSRLEIADVLRTVQRERALTVIVVTHFIEESQFLADHIVDFN